MRALVGWTCAIALAIGCNKKTDNSAAKAVDKPPAGSAAMPEATGGSAGSAGSAASAGSASADSEFEAHMKAGQAFEDQRKWPEALAEFEAAIAKKAGDARCLDEVAFTAYWAGKLDRAKEAALAAAAAAKDDKKTHGQALFNLGLAVEKTQPYAAQQLFIASLAERPNKGVAAHLAKLSKTHPEKKQSKDDLAFLDNLGVKTAAAPTAAAPPSSTPGSKEDQALMAALEGAGVEWDSGAGKSVLFVENLECTENHQGKKASYTCAAPAVKDKAAEAIVKALVDKKVAPAKEHGDMATYKVATIRCRTFNEGESGAPDECEITP